MGNEALGTGLFDNGTAVAPSMAFASQAGVGHYKTATDGVGTAVGGVVVMAIEATGITCSQPVISAKATQIQRANVASAATIASLASSAGFVKLTGSTATDLQGIAAGSNGQILKVYNATGQTLTVRNASGSAASGEKITTMTGADITTTGNGFAEFIYDTDASPAVWICSYVSV